MTRLSFLLPAAVAALLAAPAFADPTCAAPATPVPMWPVAKSFEEAGGSIGTMKVSNGCVEIYGKEAGKKVEVWFDPATGAEVGRD